MNKKLLCLLATLLSPGLYAQNACPELFHSVPLYPNARLCQVFDDELPASLSYHADAKVEDVMQYYQQQMAGAQLRQQNGRQLMEYQQGKLLVVISEDNQGAQVDIRIESP